MPVMRHGVHQLIDIARRDAIDPRLPDDGDKALSTIFLGSRNPGK